MVLTALASVISFSLTQDGEAASPGDAGYASLTALAVASGGVAERLPGSEKVRLRLGGGEILLSPGASVVFLGRSAIRLFSPPIWDRGAVTVPVREILPLMETLSPGVTRKVQASDLRRAPLPPLSDAPPQESKTLKKDSGAASGEVGHGTPRPGSAQDPSKTFHATVARPEAGPSPWLIDTIVIDPGHGGRDRGAVGPTGLEEKVVSLQVALRLKRLVEARTGLRVILTRSADTFVSLGGRARTAIEKGGRLFLSLHCNAAARRPRGAGGTEVYFLSEARTDEAREVARRENAALELEAHGADPQSPENPVLKDIFEGMSSDQFLKESQDLAAEIQRAVARSGGLLKDRGVKQAGFFVMKGTQARMPSVLVEMAFISSPREERLLRQEGFQDQLAGAILEGILGFKTRTEQAVRPAPNRD